MKVRNKPPPGGGFLKVFGAWAAPSLMARRAMDEVRGIKDCNALLDSPDHELISCSLILTLYLVLVWLVFSKFKLHR